MTIQIYSTEYKEPVPTDLLQLLTASLPVDIIQKSKKYRRWQDAYGYLFGKLLLMSALQDAGLSGNLDDVKYNSYEKPYLLNGPDFNISHSGNRVVCALGKEGSIGIDIEEIKDLAIHDFKDLFSDREWKVIINAENPLTVFYHYWTAKESIIKADGRGLTIPLTKIEIGITTKIPLSNRCWNVYKISHFKDYACHIATEEFIKQVGLKELKPVEFLVRM